MALAEDQPMILFLDQVLRQRMLTTHLLPRQVGKSTARRLVLIVCRQGPFVSFAAYGFQWRNRENVVFAFPRFLNVALRFPPFPIKSYILLPHPHQSVRCNGWVCWKSTEKYEFKHNFSLWNDGHLEGTPEQPMIGPASSTVTAIPPISPSSTRGQKLSVWNCSKRTTNLIRN